MLLIETLFYLLNLQIFGGYSLSYNLVQLYQMKTCSNPDHNKANLTEFCLNTNCSSNRLFCPHCFDEKHIDHPKDVIHLVPISNFSRIQNLAKNSNHSQQQLIQFQYSLQILNKETKEKKSQIKNMLSDFQSMIEKKIQLPIKAFYQSLSSGVVQSTVQKLLKQNRKQSKELEQIVQQILFMQRQPKRTNIQMRNKIATLKNLVLMQMNQSIKFLEENFKHLYEQIMHNIWKNQETLHEKQSRERINQQPIINQNNINSVKMQSKSYVDDYIEFNTSKQFEMKRQDVQNSNDYISNYINANKSLESNPKSSANILKYQAQAINKPIIGSSNNLKLEERYEQRLQQQNMGIIQKSDLESQNSQQQAQNDGQFPKKQIQNAEFKQKKTIKAQKSQRSKKKMQDKLKKEEAVINTMKNWGKCIKGANNQFLNIQEWLQKRKALGFLKEIVVPYPKKIKDIELPLQLAYLKHLQNLELINCCVGQIKNLSSCSRLKLLNLSHNSLKKISNLQKLKNLQMLILCHNEISKIQNLEGNENLQHINLNHNRIKKIQNIKHLQKMRLLVLSNNEMKSIEDSNVFPNIIQNSKKLQLYIDLKTKILNEKQLIAEKVYICYNFTCKCID